jgi:LuxR family maltose regulon positive regulatory protein
LVSSAALNDHDGTLAAYHYLTAIHQVQGQLTKADANYKKALVFIEKHGLQRMPHGIKILSGYGALLLHRHQLSKAKQVLRRAIQLADQSDPCRAQDAYHTLSEVFLMENDTRSALATIQKVRQISQGHQDPYQDNQDPYSLAAEARIHLETGRDKQAVQWLASSGMEYLTPDELITRFGFDTGFILAIAARVYLAKGEPEKGIDLLQAILPAFNKQNANACLVNAYAALAVIHHQTGDKAHAVEMLTHAIELAEPENNLGGFLVAGPGLAPLLHQIKVAGKSTFIQKVLGLFEALDPDQHAPANDLEQADALSPREMDVLLLISEGLTNKEISQKLYLSTNTVKSHSIKIYRKLNVNNRNQAVAKARLLGLLPMHPTDPPSRL